MRRPGPAGRDERPRAIPGGAAELTGQSADARRDLETVAAMRRGDASSYKAFVERFHRLLLDYARRASLRGVERDEFVDELLDDIALQFMKPGAPLPQNPRMYVIAAFRHKLLNAKRGRERRERVTADAVRGAAASYEFIDDQHMAAGCSESTTRASRSPEPTTSGNSLLVSRRTCRNERSRSGWACHTWSHGSDSNAFGRV